MELTKEQSAQPNDMVGDSWHERGELPPVGIECETHAPGYGWEKVWVVAKHAFEDRVIISEHKGQGKLRYGKAEDFRPIKSERERFVEAASDVIRGTSVVITGSAQLEICAALFDAGFRAPSEKG